MRGRLLLFLSASQLHAQVMTGGKITVRHEFGNSNEGREAFTAFLQTAKYPSYLLADLIEEDFRLETIPHLSGRNRKALLQRKFDQYYRGTLFRQATLLQRQKTGRRDDEMLFSALTNMALVIPWLEIMQAQHIPLAGIYSVPQVSTPLLGDYFPDHLLLISWEKSAGLRQSFFNKNRLQISRLTPVSAGASFQDTVAKELGRTCQYLKSLSLLPEGQVLDVRIIGHRDDLAELQSRLPADADIRYDLADIEEVAGQIKLDFNFIDSDANQIFLHVLAAKPPKTHYAQTVHMHDFTLWQLRHILNRLSGAVLVGSLLWGTTNIILSNDTVNASEALRIQTQIALNEAQQITQALPGTRIPAADMKTSVSIMRRLDKYPSTPQAILKPVSMVLDHFPQIELNNFDWRMNGSGPDTNDAAVSTGQIPDTGTTITIKASLHGFVGDYRAALAYLDRFQRELGATGYQVTVMNRPLDVSSGGTITDQREAPEKALDFSLQLIRKTSV
ncbi:MAG: hypothetical protein PHP70_02025 [Gallionella sp.]|nr:hypothetical protein [Gallionella sp.]